MVASITTRRMVGTHIFGEVPVKMVGVKEEGCLVKTSKSLLAWIIQLVGDSEQFIDWKVPFLLHYYRPST